MREDFGVSIVAIERGGKRLFSISPETVIEDGDTLILEGDESDFRRRDVEPFMEHLTLPELHEQDFQSRAQTVIEAMLSPRSRLIGQTLRSSHFREKYGMNALALWRRDEEIIIGLADAPLEFGDALLLQGSREKLNIMRDDPDLILLMQKEDAAITVPGKGRAALIDRHRGFAARHTFAESDGRDYARRRVGDDADGNFDDRTGVFFDQLENGFSRRRNFAYGNRSDEN